MAIVIGQDGVVRELQGVDAGKSYTRYHAAENYACMDGVVRQVTDVLDEIDRIEISIENVNVYQLEADAGGSYSYTLIGSSMADVNAVGSITVTENSVQVNTTTALRDIDLSGYVYVVYRDGHKTFIRNVRELETLTFQVGYYLYFNRNGGYNTSFLGNMLKEGYVSGSASGTVTVSTESLVDYTIFLGSELYTSGTQRNRQTYTSCTAGGKTIPIAVVNRLT